MFKERIFTKTITVDNFCLVEDLTINPLKGKPLKKEVELIAQVYYTPRGYICELEHFTPLDIWNYEQFSRVEGINKDSPEGSLSDNFFDTKLAAMHFITRHLKRLGWNPLGGWGSTLI